MTTIDTEQALDDVLEEYLAEANAAVGEVKPVPARRITHHDYVLGFTQVTEDLIKMFSVANGDTNPMWRDPDYAAASPWGGLIAPPLFIYTASSVTPIPEPPAIEGFDLYAAGSRVEFHAPIRPGDRFSAEDVWNGVQNRSRPGRPHRTLIFNGERRFYNQQGDRLATLHCRAAGTVLLPGSPPVGKSLQGRELFAYSDDELQEIYSHYDQELAGDLRRGAEPRFWEDVSAGDDLGLVLKGPLDILDNAAFLGVIGGGLGFADKWEMIRTELGRSPRDPITRAYHYQMDWHLADSSAQAAGMPRAIAFGVFMEMNLTHLVNNWIGDHGWVQEFETRSNPRCSRATFSGSPERSRAPTRRTEWASQSCQSAPPNEQARFS